MWWVWLQALDVRTRTRVPGVPQVRYWPSFGTTQEIARAPSLSDGLATWSPTLFALPAAFGFSRVVLTNEIGVRPPLAMPPVGARFLPRAPRELAEPAGLDVEPRMTATVAGVLSRFPMRVRAEPVFRVSALTGLVVRTELSGALAGGRVEDPALPAPPDSLKDRSWDVLAFVEVDEGGRVRHALLERRSPSDAFNADLVRAIRLWRVTGVETPASGRIAVRGFAPPPAIPQEARTP